MELWARNCRAILPKFRLPLKFRDLLHAANLRHGTDGFTSPPKEGVLRIFFRPKNPTTSAGFEPANLGTKGQHATPRPPKPLLFVDTTPIVLVLHYPLLNSLTRAIVVSLVSFSEIMHGTFLVKYGFCLKVIFFLKCTFTR